MAMENLPKIYQHILLTIDLHPGCDEPTVMRAATIAKAFNAQDISIIHAIEHVNAYGVAQAYPTILDLEEQMVKEAEQELAKWGMKVGIPKSHQYVEVGSPKSVILHKAKELNIDLIVVGSHGRHGINMLLGSTANAVLHHAHCDVLAVRVQE